MLDLFPTSSACDLKSDPIFLAIGLFKEAEYSYTRALKEIEKAGGFSDYAATPEEINSTPYNLKGLELAEATAADRLIEAESILLATKPTSLAGGLALLSYLRTYLTDFPRLRPIITSITNVEAVLSEIDKSSAFVSETPEY